MKELYLGDIEVDQAYEMTFRNFMDIMKQAGISHVKIGSFIRRTTDGEFSGNYYYTEIGLLHKNEKCKALFAIYSEQETGVCCIAPRETVDEIIKKLSSMI